MHVEGPLAPGDVDGLIRAAVSDLDGPDGAADLIGATYLADPAPGAAWVGGGGVAVVVLRGRRAHLRLLWVPGHLRRRGWGRRLTDAAAGWAAERGARVLVTGGEAPRYLWPGVDETWPGAVAAMAALGFRETARAVNMRCRLPLDPPPPPAPAGVEIRRVDDRGTTLDATVELVGRSWPHWVDETVRAADAGTLFVAVMSDGSGSPAVVGFAAHSVNRRGWFGPTGTDEAHRGRGIGGALLEACAADLVAGGRRRMEIAWVGPVDYYRRVAAARISRRFRLMSLPLGGT